MSQCRYSEEQIRQLFTLRSKGLSVEFCARKIGMYHVYASRLLRGSKSSWQHIFKEFKDRLPQDKITTTTITLSSIGSIASEDAFLLMVSRLGTNGSDTMAGTAQVLTVEVKSAS